MIWKKEKKREKGVSVDIEENLGREWIKVTEKLGENEALKKGEHKGKGKRNGVLEWMRGRC